LSIWLWLVVVAVVLIWQVVVAQGDLEREQDFP
jgi:hypothetical protein